MKNIGRVVNLKQDLAEIAVGKHAACKRCGACLASLDPKQRTLLATNELGVGIGDIVEFEVPPVRAVGAAFLLFIAPLFISLAGAYFGYRTALALGWPETPVAAGFGILAFMLSFILLRYVERARSRSGMARVLQILPDEE